MLLSMCSMYSGHYQLDCKVKQPCIAEVSNSTVSHECWESEQNRYQTTKRNAKRNIANCDITVVFIDESICMYY